MKGNMKGFKEAYYKYMVNREFVGNLRPIKHEGDCDRQSAPHTSPVCPAYLTSATFYQACVFYRYFARSSTSKHYMVRFDYATATTNALELHVGREL